MVRYTYFLGLDIYVKLQQSFFLRGDTAGYRTFDLWKKAEVGGQGSISVRHTLSLVVWMD